VKVRTYKYRLYPTKEQEVLIAKTFGCVRFIYNRCLALKSEAFQSETKENISLFALANRLSGWKDEEDTKWLAEVNSQSLQMAIRNLDNAYTRFFREKKGFPKFKNRFDAQSFCNPQSTKVDWDAGRVFIPKFKAGIKAKLHRRFDGVVKSSVVSRSASGQYFIAIVVEEAGEELSVTPSREETCVGIDLGIKTYVTLSDGTEVANPKHLAKKLRKLRRASRRHSRSQKGGKNREKRRRVLAVCHRRVSDARKDFLHKLTHRLVENQDYQSFAIETLGVRDMMKGRLARSIADAAWGTFSTFLQYKAKRAGKEVVQIGQFEPSSRMCDGCGVVNSALTLKDREWTCSCGKNHSRDLLAARNIKRFAFCKQDVVGAERPKQGRKTRKPVERPVRGAVKQEAASL